MNPTFEKLYRELGRVTFVVLLAALTSYGITVMCALVGLSRAVISFRGVTASLAYVFAVLLALFLTASLVATVIRWLDRRSQIRGSRAI
jgi:hypothetical protein